MFLGQNVQQPQNESSTKRKADRPTRVRTVLNEKQLHTLRTCYNANPRPDAMMKEQLVEMTGLSPRVIRVWFQNKRCKDKKKATFILKSQNPNQQQNTDDLQVKRIMALLRSLSLFPSYICVSFLDFCQENSKKTYSQRRLCLHLRIHRSDSLRRLVNNH